MEILPGQAENRKTLCLSWRWFDKLFPLQRPAWNEAMAFSDEERMLMEVTGWTKEQLFNGLKKYSEELSRYYTIARVIRIFFVAVFFLFGTLITLAELGIITSKKD
ncbi:Oidioi.mRNA.OKI2018_I69.chr1.g46.t1.cds [Oikopleura dioica]|uniref:Oidioi.mRNA.OKI2018_I69.chr1.g46.t1.cds n=1 Tax=Oikopleura dioica TaxID=34765 RepID=A0ABN7SMF5_OIKDI|nr:Oidioi.mRNA.OKI2018_I69.chr1.g46.t1.cds [Oikopleura dioica]